MGGEELVQTQSSRGYFSRHSCRCVCRACMQPKPKRYDGSRGRVMCPRGRPNCRGRKTVKRYMYRGKKCVKYSCGGRIKKASTSIVGTGMSGTAGVVATWRGRGRLLLARRPQKRDARASGAAASVASAHLWRSMQGLVMCNACLPMERTAGGAGAEAARCPDMEGLILLCVAHITRRCGVAPGTTTRSLVQQGEE